MKLLDQDIAGSLRAKTRQDPVAVIATADQAHVKVRCASAIP